MSKSILIKLIVIAALLVSTGCSIEPFPGSGEPTGSIYVSAVDSAGVDIHGPDIILDGVPRPERTPAYLHGIAVGGHTVIIRRFGFWDDTSSVAVNGGDTALVEAVLRPVPLDQEGWLRFDSQPPGGRLLLNGRTFIAGGDTVFAPTVVRLPWGAYPVSSHLVGYATTSPLLPLIEVAARETSAVAFLHELRQTAKQVGALPFGFTLESLDGDTVSLSDLTGYVVLLNFWYVNCPPCKAEFPGIEAVFRERAADGFRVLAVNPMLPDTREDILSIREGFGLTFQLLLDCDQYVTRNLYDVNRFPTNILIDRTGTIHAVMSGVSQEELGELVDGLLAAGGGD